MAAVSQNLPHESKDAAGYVGRIPVRNLWLLMLYASRLREVGNAWSAVEDNPDNISNLVAELLCHKVEWRIRRNLSYGYRHRHEVLNRVRGRIDLLGTESKRLLDQGKVACHFDEFTVNTPRNRYVRAALEKLSKIVNVVNAKNDLAGRCRVLARGLAQMGVTGHQPHRNEVSIDRFGRHDMHDQPMVTVAHLALN
ncbi:MAG: 5-methylcytosine-specific restriction endonuclease system specificity protein McrC, partial [Proteobacteria bacterium]|nr:5-methylcytosine-specific restriction endonuclease system specificity protein McrC [Pseudomonadota bacterium]